MVTNLTSEKLNSSLGDADYDNDNHVFSIQPVVLNSKTDGEIILMLLKMAMIKMILRREKLPPNHLPPNIHQRKRKKSRTTTSSSYVPGTATSSALQALVTLRMECLKEKKKEDIYISDDIYKIVVIAK